MRPIRTLAPTAAAVILALIVGAAPASAADTALLVQHADKARLDVGKAKAVTLVMLDGGKPLLTFEERPGRGVSSITQSQALKLWDSAFSTSAPNAVLLGRTTQGRQARIVLELTEARKVRGGVRYRGELLSGRASSVLTDATLVIDGVPASSAGFPSTVAPASPPDLTVTAGQSATFSGPAEMSFGVITIEPGGSLVLSGSTAVVVGSSLAGVVPPGCGPVAALGGVASADTGSGTCSATLTSTSGTITISSPASDQTVLTDVVITVS